MQKRISDVSLYQSSLRENSLIEMLFEELQTKTIDLCKKKLFWKNTEYFGKRFLVACASELLNKDRKEPIFILSPSSIAAKRALDDKALHRTSSAELVRVVAH